MYQLDRANWWLPGWLGRFLPTVSVESAEDVAYEDAEIADVPELSAAAAPHPAEGARAGQAVS